MANIVDSPPRHSRGRLAQLISRAIGEHLITDAPADYDEVMEGVPASPGWVGILALAALILFSLIIFVVIALCGAAS